MTKLITLTEADVRVLKGLVEQQRNYQRNTAGRTLEATQPTAASQMYVAMAPVGGIAGRVGFTVSGASCAIYQQVAGILISAGFSRTVYNLSTIRIGREAVVSVTQDNYGGWWAVDPAHGLDSTTCSIANIRITDTLLATDANQFVTLTYNSTLGKWRSSATFLYPNGMGIVEFWYADGRARLSVDSKELIGCGDGCFIGGPLTGHASNDTGVDVTETPCTGETFSVCIECTTPDEIPGTGTSTGGGGSGGTIVTSCCPARLFPTTLYGTFSGQTGNCTCMTTPLVFNWLSGQIWEAVQTSDCGGPINDGKWYFYCDAAGTGFLTALTNGVWSDTDTTAQCDPLLAVFNLGGSLSTPRFCDDNVILTVTE